MCLGGFLWPLFVAGPSYIYRTIAVIFELALPWPLLRALPHFSCPDLFSSLGLRVKQVFLSAARPSTALHKCPQGPDSPLMPAQYYHIWLQPRSPRPGPATGIKTRGRPGLRQGPAWPCMSCRRLAVAPSTSARCAPTSKRCEWPGCTPKHHRTCPRPQSALPAMGFSSMRHADWL